MITGQVNEFYEAVIPIRLQDRQGAVHKFEAIVDTGFNGSLTLPPEIIAALQLPWRTRGSALLANGREETFDIYAGAIIWDDTRRSVLVEAVEMQPLVGMRLLENHDMQLRVQPGGSVQIIAAP